MTDLYSVSIGTVRRAVVELRRRGLVATLPAKGTYVIEVPRPSGDEPAGGELRQAPGLRTRPCVPVALGAAQE